MKKGIYLFAFLFQCNILIAQIPTFSQNIAPIIFNHCTNCHRPGNIAPFALTNYDEVSSAANSISYAVNNKIMPPWSPDPQFRHYINERVLSDTEIQAINDWISFGMPEGDTSLLPEFPSFFEGSEIGIPDVQFALPHYVLNSSSDEYRCFVLHSSFSQDVFIKSLEFIPGNKLIDHHAVIFWDTTGACQQLDDQTIEPGYNSFSSFAGTDSAKKIGIWVPGSPPLILPQNFGFHIPANADIIVQMHYPSGSVGLMDSSRLNIFFQQGTQIRNVQLKSIINIINLVDGPLIIPADSILTFHAQSTFSVNTSLISVFPHMHLIGSSTISYAVQPNGDTVNLISIPNWSFHWQGFYTYEKPVVMKQNAVIYSEFTYNNTSSNLDNPNFPPQEVTYGNGSENEMLVTAFLSVPYQHGDENIILNSNNIVSEKFNNEISIYPNPGNGMFILNLNKNQNVSAMIFNVEGLVVKQLFNHLMSRNESQYQICDAQDLPSGIYFLKIHSNEINIVKQLIIIH